VPHQAWCEMRLIHFSDTHLGFTESSRADPATGVNVREQDVYAAFNGIIQEAIARKPDLVVHAGDLFHSPRPSNRAIVTALVGFQRLSEAGIPVVLIAGNHSVPRVAATGSIFEAMRVLPGIRAAFSGRYEVFEVGEAAVHCVPHVATEVGLRAALDSVSPLPAKRFNVLLMHGGLRGTGEQYSLGEFNEVTIVKDVLARFDAFDYVALGHYHRHIHIGANAWYSGSPERFHQNEAGYKKGFIEVDLATRKAMFHPTSPREIAILPGVNCRGRSVPEIVSAAADALRSAQPLKDKIVIVRLEQIDPTTWTELQRQRRPIEDEHAADVFEIRWDPSFSEPKGTKSRSSTIGSLAAEFAAFIKTAKVEGLDRSRLRRLGERFISDALEAEGTE